jgi:hypothetical protein
MPTHYETNNSHEEKYNSIMSTVSGLPTSISGLNTTVSGLNDKMDRVLSMLEEVKQNTTPRYTYGSSGTLGGNAR